RRAGDPEWAPTLLRVDGDAVRAWTGARLAVPLARRLGLRTSAGVLRALGRLRREAAGHPLDRPGIIDRAGFLRLGAGAVVAAGMVVAGKTPAFAERTCTAAQAWVDAHHEALPAGYDAFAAYPMAYRRAIYAAHPAAVRGTLWVEHLTRFGAARTGLSAAQRAVIDTAVALAADPAVHDPDGRPDGALRDLHDDAVAAFGEQDAYALLGTLGPDDGSAALAARAPDCDCSTYSVWCHGYPCRRGMWNCRTSDGCGDLWAYKCNGMCLTD
ncbi:bacteriocin fulvocin C-related protein, partial [Jiangella muralis]|uniref:bacteriocin fulvocin C-related protein n=1 Tax=Jiangella muralis TaxID=702383 RepID=UPI000B02A004